MTIFDPAHPGEILGEDVLKALPMTITEASQRLGISRKMLSSIVNGRSTITADTAVKLEKVFKKPSAEQWLRLQSAYDIFHARQRHEAAEITQGHYSTKAGFGQNYTLIAQNKPRNMNTNAQQRPV